MNEKLDDMYREIILDHYRAPRGKKPVEKTDIASDGHNPSCGDDIVLRVEIDKDKVKDVHVDCKGCAISVASGSMLAEYIKGKPLSEAKKIAEQVRKMLKGEDPKFTQDVGDIDSLKGVKNFPVRIKCALLAWMTLIEGVKKYETGKVGDSFEVTTEDDDNDQPTESK